MTPRWSQSKSMQHVSLQKTMVVIGLVCIALLLAQCTKEATLVPETTPVPASETAQIIEKEYGEWLRREPGIFFVPPAIDPSLSLEDQAIQLNKIMEERSKRAQDLYDAPSYKVFYEFSNPLFKEAFPQSHMYAVVTNIDATDQAGDELITMVAVGERNYRMPTDFNQLMVDAGHQLTGETRDTLAYAYIIAGMPTRMAERSVTCEPGREIDETITSARLVYEIDCTVAYQNIGAVTVLFFPFDSLFGGVSVGWGTIHESGWRNQGFQFGSRGVE